MTGRTTILNPTLPASVKRRQFLLDSLRKSGLQWSEGNRGNPDHHYIRGRTKAPRAFIVCPKANSSPSAHPGQVPPVTLPVPTG